MATNEEKGIIMLAQQAALLQLIVTIIVSMEKEKTTWIIQELDDFCERYKKSLREKTQKYPEDQIFSDALDNFLLEIKQKVGP